MSPLFKSLTLFLILVCGSPSLADEPGQATSQGREITNSIGMKLELIPAGEFMMGGGESAEELVKAFAAYNRKAEFFDDEYPRHRVRITKPFYLGKYEVTVGQFRQFVNDTGYKTEAETDATGGWGYNPQTGQCEGRKPEFNWLNPGFEQTDDHPVLNVTWNDAAAFCRWLSARKEKPIVCPPRHSGNTPAAVRPRRGIKTATIRPAWRQWPTRWTTRAGPLFHTSKS